MALPAYLEKKHFRPAIRSSPATNLKLVVTIPAYNEPALINSLQSLWECQRPYVATEALVLINHSAIASTATVNTSKAIYEQAKSWARTHHDAQLQFHILYKPDLPPKKAGVGLARQLVMDEALYRLHLAGQPHGVIAGFDADSACATNYLTSIAGHYSKHPHTKGTSIYFAHPLEGDAHPEEVYAYIRDYELYLRYYRMGLYHTGHPHAFHTIGSAFTVRADIYAQEGGMNKRKAGEDFYFLHKIIPLGGFYEQNGTAVYPSPRPSNRVPFGTGAAISDMLEQKPASYLTYHPLAFTTIRPFIKQAYKLLHGQSWQTLLPESPEKQQIIDFLHDQKFPEALNKMLSHSPDYKVFHQRFFAWFTAFRMLKYLNHMHHVHFSKIPVDEAATQMLKLQGIHKEGMPVDPTKLLKQYRRLDMEGLTKRT